MGDEANCSVQPVLRVRIARSAVGGVVARRSPKSSNATRRCASRSIWPTNRNACCPPSRSHCRSPTSAQWTNRNAGPRSRSVLDREVRTPFDLGDAPLWRAQLIREAPDHHRFVFTAHHVIVDGWSSAVIFGDLAKAYLADRSGVPATLPPAASFREFVADQHSPPSPRRWPRRSSTGPAGTRTACPLNSPRPGQARVRTHTPPAGSGSCSTGALPGRPGMRRPAGHDTVRHVARGVRVLIARLSAVDDLVVRVPIAGQALRENSDLVAHAVNTLPLRAHVDARHTFAEHLRAVRGTFLDAQAHPRLTFGTLVQKLKLPRDPSRTPLVPVIFNVGKTRVCARLRALDVAETGTQKAFYNFDLGPDRDRRRRKLRPRMRLQRGSLRRRDGRAGSAVPAAARRRHGGPTVPLAELSLLTPAERAVLVGGSGGVFEPGM